MGRIFSRWAVTTLGLVLLTGGLAAMAQGWSVIQVERGWSMFLAGASALAGGAVVVALGQVLARLDALTAATRMRSAEPPADASPRLASAATNLQERPAKPSPQPAADADAAKEFSAPQPSPRQEPKPVPATGPETPRKAPLRKSYLTFKTETPRASEPVDPAGKETGAGPSDAQERSLREPKEVDRYESGGVTYVMFSNGEVEVRTLEGAQRYPSLEELRAQAAQGY